MPLHVLGLCLMAVVPLGLTTRSMRRDTRFHHSAGRVRVRRINGRWAR